MFDERREEFIFFSTAKATAKRLLFSAGDFLGSSYADPTTGGFAFLFCPHKKWNN